MLRILPMTSETCRFYCSSQLYASSDQKKELKTINDEFLQNCYVYFYPDIYFGNFIDTQKKNLEWFKA